MSTFLFSSNMLCYSQKKIVMVFLVIFEQSIESFKVVFSISVISASAEERHFMDDGGVTGTGYNPESS